MLWYSRYISCIPLIFLLVSPPIKTTFHLSHMHYIYLFSLLRCSNTTHTELPSTYWKIEEGSDITGIYMHGSSCITYLQFTSALHIIISSDLK